MTIYLPILKATLSDNYKFHSDTYINTNTHTTDFCASFCHKV